MRIKNYFKKFTLLALFLFGTGAFSFAQNTGAPREEKLLNGMKLLVWTDLKAEKTSVKLRIDSGSAFDPAAKEGVMALLADILFPTQTAREYFEEDLGGSIEITSNYDYIQINTTGDNDKILEILEALAQAVSKPQIDKDTTARVKAAKLEKVIELEKNRAYVAEQAVTKRLFGNFPYGRPQLGSTESLSKIDFADVLLAKQKFLTADNATLAVSGNVKFEFVYRAARRLFGGWEKADKKVPSTFTAPDSPDTKPLILSLPSVERSETWVAMNGFARNDKDFFASQILTKLCAMQFPPASVSNKSYLLSGIIIFDKGVPKLFSSGQDKVPVGSSVFREIKQDDFEKAKTDFLNELNQRNLSDLWLDIDTYNLVSVKDEIQKANNIKFEDVQKVADRIEKQPFAIVILAQTNSAVK